MTIEEMLILTLRAKVNRLEQELNALRAHVNVSCVRCGREGSTDYQGNEYHLHSNSRFCDEEDVERYRNSNQ